MPDPIDTGTAPTIYCDDLGKIQIKQHTVCWCGVEEIDDHTVIVVKVITPISAVPSIAAQIVGAFAGMMTKRVTDKLRIIADYMVH